MPFNYMHFSIGKKHYLVLLYNLLWLTMLSAQTISSDEYFQMARKAAFDNKNYTVAIQLSKQALLQSPDYVDIQIFLGRVYYWNGQPDSSLLMLKAALQNKPSYEDASIAITDIEYFSENYTSALHYAGLGLVHHPSSKELMLRKAKCLAALLRYKAALFITDSLLQTDPKNNELRVLAARIKDYRSKSKIGISYDYTGFDKQFSNPWHIVSFDYSRQTRAGSLTGRLNYANRHTKNGVQFEVDAYPRLSKTFYAYTNIGYSNDMPVFPKFRAGLSLYANLPRSFEGEAGFRYLNFDSDTWIYTLALGKYYKNFWFNGRSYLTPSNSRISQSYTVTVRYYGKSAENYFSLAVGRGISPDDRSLAIQLNNAYKLQTKKISAGYRFTAGKLNIFSLSTSFENVEYLPKTRGNQVNISAGYQRRF
ncbi:MAG: YaiO family outer membrane beta-barrel protein [Ferruginibacter sp.]|nr:YaiO family outer membrane beta-barrel protein [Ferruginibacter sp.]